MKAYTTCSDCPRMISILSMKTIEGKGYCVRCYQNATEVDEYIGWLLAGKTNG